MRIEHWVPWPRRRRDDEQEAAEIAALIRDTLVEHPQGNIAVLARARTHLHTIAVALQRIGLRYQAVQVDPLGDRPTVRDLHSLTRALLHPADRLAWLALLRSPLIGMELPDLVRLCADDRDLPLWQLLCDEQRLGTLSPDGQRRCRRRPSLMVPG